MMIKFLRHGSGCVRAAVNYLVRQNDHKNELRAEVKVLRGDPQQFAAVAESAPFRLRYTSGVYAWSKNDNPSDAEMEAVLDAHERLARGGL